LKAPGEDMNKSIQVLIAAAVVCTAVSACQPAAKDAGNAIAAGQSPAPPASVSTPVDSTAASAAKPKAAAPVKQTAAATTPVAPSGASDAAAKTAAARSDSIARAQERTDALIAARLDSVKQAEAAKAAAKAPPSVAAPGTAAQAGPDLTAQGKVPYEANCRKCHGVRGVPPKTMQAKFAKIMVFDAAFFAKRSADSIVTVLTKGKDEDMTSFADKLSHSEMLAVAAYIRSFVTK